MSKKVLIDKEGLIMYHDGIMKEYIKPLQDIVGTSNDGYDVREEVSKVNNRVDAVDSQLEHVIKNSCILNIIDFESYVRDDDWSDAFQKAFDHLSEGYSDSDINNNTKLISLLELPSGHIFKIKKTVYIKSPVLVKGLGANGTTCISGDWEGSNYFDLFEIRDTTHSARICFENIRFRNIPPTKSAIYVPTTFEEDDEFRSGFMVDGYISKCWFENFNNNSGCGIRGSIADYLIEGNVFEHCNPCIDISIHDGQNRIINNIMYNCYNGVKITGFNDEKSWQTMDTIISNNHFNFPPNDAVGGAFVNINKYSNFVISSNTTTAYGNNQLLDNAIILTDVKKGVINNNVFSGLVLKGITATRAYNCIISDNIIEKNLTTNGVIGIELINSKLNNVVNNNISNLGNIKTSHGILINNDSNANTITNNIIMDTNYGLRILGGIQNIVNLNRISSTIKYILTDNNYVEKGNEGTTIRGQGDYIMTGSETKNIIFNLTSFSTCNFNFKGEFIGDSYTLTVRGATLKVYDGYNSLDIADVQAQAKLDVVWDGYKWFIACVYKSD